MNSGVIVITMPPKKAENEFFGQNCPYLQGITINFDPLITGVIKQNDWYNSHVCQKDEFSTTYHL